MSVARYRGGEQLGPAAPGFGALLRHHRLRRALSLKALADRAALHYAELSRLESGQRTPVRATVDRIAAALALSDREREALFAQAGYVAVLPPPFVLEHA